MSDQPSMHDLKQARVVAAMRSLAILIMELEAGRDDRAMRIINLKADLTDEERAALLEVVLGTFTADQAQLLIEDCFASSGAPPPPFGDDPRPEAKLWAASATGREHMAYACASFAMMPRQRRDAFKKWIEGVS